MIQRDFETLISKYIIFKREGRYIGRQGNLRVHYFLDLASAAHSRDDLEALAGVFAKFISKNGKIEEIDRIASPKRGNGLLAKCTSDILKKKSAFVRDSIMFDRWIEGHLVAGEKVILVDDVASNSDMLVEAIEGLRRTGIYCEALYVLVDRKEGDSAAILEIEGVKYYYLYSYDDDEFGRLMGQTA